jgi:ribosomal protein L11
LCSPTTPGDAGKETAVRSQRVSKSLNEKLSRDGYMVVKILILVVKSYDFTIMLALNDYDYTYNPTFVESGGLPI